MQNPQSTPSRDTVAECDMVAERLGSKLAGAYDCLDRFVLYARYWFACTPGGFRTWWRFLYGNDDNLDKEHLMRLAGRFSRRLRAWAEKHDVPVLDMTSGEDRRMHRRVEPLIPTDPDFRGVFCITVSRAPARIWQVQRFGNGGMNLRRIQAWVNHYSFHIMDPEFGHMTFRMCGHAPFETMITMNGHDHASWLMEQRGIESTRNGNCFTGTSSFAGLQQCADALCDDSTRGRLFKACERWLYSACLCFALDEDERLRSGFQYDYSIYQAEYSRNYVFKTGRNMEDWFQDLIDRLRRVLDVRQLKTIFGRKRRPSTQKATGKPPRLEMEIVQHEHDLTVLKIHFQRLTLKIYSKGAGVLRVEAIAHNVKDLKCGVVLRQYTTVLARLREIVERFVEVIADLEQPWIGGEEVEDLSRPSDHGARRLAGIDLTKPRMQAALACLLSLSAQPGGFTSSDLASTMSAHIGQPVSNRQAAYDLRKFRGKGLVQPIPHSQRYRIHTEGLRPLAALWVLRDKVIFPLLSREGHLSRGPACHQTSLDRQYHRLQKEMQSLFKLLNIAC